MNKTTILIVEDEAIVAADLANKLRRLGYEVAGTAAGGEEAVALACSLRPQLVLMDIRLEGSIDGIEAADSIRRLHDAPLIYLTAHSDNATLARAKLTGPFGYILKPFEERDLATQIELALYKHRADRQLHEQREWLRVTLMSIGDAVIATDAAGRITFVNPVAESLTGWKAEEAVGQPIPRVFNLVNEQTGQAMKEPVARVLREGRAVPLANHAALVTKDGRTVPIEDSAAPILDAARQVIGAVLVFHEVTEKRRAEEALRESEHLLRRSRDELDQRVRERTAELEIYMGKLLESNQALQEFASIASHDMQEPLRKVVSFGNMLEQKYGGIIGEEGKDFLNRMLGATERMQSLLTSLLEYSRIATKAEPFREVDLNAVIQGVLSDLEVRIEKTEGQVDVGELPVIYAEPTHMRQLFQNLIGNALKFHRKGGKPFIEVRGTSHGNNGTAEIAVTDNGIGFDEKYLDKIFAPFQRLHGRGEYEGTGMGLAICKKIVERHGGSITARSKSNQGSTFIITLPMKQNGRI